MSLLKCFWRELANIMPLFCPILLSQYAGIANGVVDTVMTARLGAVELGAVAVGVAILVPFNLFTMAVLYGMLMSVSRHHGAGDLAKVRQFAHQGLWLGFGLGVCSALLTWLLSYRLLWLGVDPLLAEPAGEYIRIVALSYPLLGLAYAMRFFCDGQKVMLPMTVISVAMVGINALLNYGLMFGNLGLPALGLKGCAMATSVSAGCFLVLIALFIRFAPMSPGQSYFRQIPAPVPDVMLSIVRIGVPIGLAVTSEYLIFTVIALFVATTGVVATAAHQICFSIMVFFFATPSALSVATSIRIGNLLGQGAHSSIRHVTRGIMLLAVIIGVALSSIMIFCAKPLTGIFTVEAAVLELAAKLLLIAGFFQLADAVQACLNGILRGCGDTLVPFLLTSGSYWLVCLPVGYLLSGMPLPANLGVSPDLFGVAGWWMALTVGILMASALLALRVRKVFGEAFHHAGRAGEISING